MALTLCACANILGFEEGTPHESGSGGAAGAASAMSTGAATATSSSTAGQGGTAPAYFDVVMEDEPCGYWRLGEDTTPVAFDASSNGIDGTYLGVTLGATGALAGDPDTAAVFDGMPGTKLEIEGDMFRFVGTQPFSVELWVKPPALAGGYPTVIGKFDDLGAVMNGWWIYAKGGDTVFLRDDGTTSTAAAGPPLALDVFTHLVATYDGTTMTLYLNGAITEQQASDLQIADHDRPLAVGGRFNDDAPFAATIDEVAIYCKALEPIDVLEHYRAAGVP